MLFNLFGKKVDKVSEQLFSDKTYMTTEAKMKAIILLAKEKEETVFIGWFADTITLYKKLFADHGLGENRIRDTLHLHTAQLYNAIPVFLEHHPLHSKEAELVKNWQQQKLVVYNSLDEPLFKQFGSDKIISLMKMLGMKEEDAIEHELVSKSILRAQDKIALKITTEMTAGSQQEWIDKNLK